MTQWFSNWLSVRMWTLSRGAAFVCDLNVKLRPIGYHAGIVGGVVNRGWSDKDLDLVIMRTRNEGEPNLLKLNMLLGQMLGHWHPCGSWTSDKEDRWDVRKFYLPHHRLFNNCWRRVDVFIECAPHSKEQQ